MVSRRAAPAAQGTVVRNVQRSTNRMKLRHSEFISTIDLNPDFTATKLEMNAGLAGCFPWLNRVAINFEHYKFNYVNLVYEPFVGSQQPGQAYVMFDYDCNDQPPLSIADVANTQDSVRGALWRGWKAPLDIKACTRGLDRMLVRDGDVTGDKNAYDMCNVFFGVFGNTGATVGTAGYLHIEYEIELIKPQMSLQHSPAASEITNLASEDGLTQTVNPGLTAPLRMLVDEKKNGLNFTSVANDAFNVPQKGMYQHQYSAQVEVPPGAAVRGNVFLEQDGVQIPGTKEAFSFANGGGSPELLKVFCKAAAPLQGSDGGLVRLMCENQSAAAIVLDTVRWAAQSS